MGGPRTIPTLHAALLSAVLLLSGLSAGCGPDAAGGSSSPVSAPDREASGERTAEPGASEGFGEEMGWDEIDELIDERRYRAALEAVTAIRERAREAGDGGEWTRALVREFQLQTGLGGYETAVRQLREAPWPEAPLSRAVLDLYYAHSLVGYLGAYGWEIGQRERVESGEEVDLRRWTREQIVDEAHRTFDRIWRQRSAWGDEPLGELGEYILANSYPRRIRGTLRDAVTYLWVELAANSSFWGAGQEQGLYRLDLEALIAGGPEAAGGAPAARHPLELLGALLADLEAWHRQADRPEAAFEARLERLRRLHAAFSRADDREAIRRGLERALADLGRTREWWSVGQALLAEWIRDAGGPDSQVRAREIALAGVAAHPDSVGGGRCRHIVAAIEAPVFGLEAMTADGLGRRSVRVGHRNLAELTFRAYRMDLLGVLEGAQDYNLLPGHREVQELVENATPTAEWTVELPPTPDYRRHATYVTPPLDEAGLYVLVASARGDFAEAGNRRGAVRLLLGDLVLLTRQLEDEIEVTVRGGASGRPVADAEVLLYRYDWQSGHRRTAALRTEADGTARFAAGRWRRGAYFVVVRRGDELALDPSYLDLQRRRRARDSTAALIFTDRSVYRPGQEVLWKVVAYRGSGDQGRFATLSGRSLTVELRDANGETVDSAEVTTNDYGSASGAFTLPHGRLLGRWWLEASLGGSARIRVEEYKRPTFEVEIAEPAEPLRLNLPASLAGEARYYFGLPVAGGAVSWQVTREPIYPPWWHRWFEPPRVVVETVAAGAGEVAADGSFSVRFTPAADEREAADGVSYRYRLSVDVTDEGGETRSATRVFRVGFATVAATLEPAAGFLEAGAPATVDVRRHDLDGSPRPGTGVWRLLEVRQPERALLPAEQPAAPREGHRTAGDRLRPRWDPGLPPAAVVGGWPDGRELLRGELSHDENGEAGLRLPALGPGVYRLRYETRDPWGAAFETRRELVVAAPAATELALPAVLLVERPSVPVGETIRLLVHSGLPDQELVLETLRNGRRIERRRLESADGLRIVEILATGEHRGGLGFRLTAVRDHQLLSLTGSALVPWDDRRLEVGFATFRDRLRPGARESWRVTVRGAGEEILAAGAAELLAYMYDRSLDLFAPHRPPEPLALYPRRGAPAPARASLGGAFEIWRTDRDWARLPGYPTLTGDRLRYLPGYGIGGPGGRRLYRRMRVPAPMQANVPLDAMDERAETIVVTAEAEEPREAELAEPPPEPAAEAPAELRTDFSETAFWEPHLVLGEDGAVAFEFTVPDSVTEWSVWVHALTRELRAGSATREVKTVKELMVRPYLPRFLREGDRALVRVLVNNASERTLEGRLDFDLLDPATDASLLAEFGLEAPATLPFRVEPQGGAELEFALQAPLRVGEVAVRAVARAGELSDGELRALPLLPGRLHLSQSRFAALKDRDRRELTFADLADARSDPSLVHDQLVVTLDAQLFYSVLRALPYLVDYPYECTEQTVNRFLSTGILSSLYGDYPAVARMARELSARPTRFERWDAVDPNRKMALEETPWRVAARGGAEAEEDLIRVLDPRVVAAEKRAALAELEKAQTSLGGFPWWPGGPPSPYLTLYILHGFARGLEFEVEVPRDLVVRAWAYLHRHYVDELAREMAKKDCCWELVTFLNYVLSAYPDESWTGDVFTAEDRERMLEFSYRHWREHSPLLKGYLALTLARAGRPAEARRVFDSVMDSARTDRDLGTWWAPEERAWLWYNDTVEGHAFALRTLTELTPDDPRRHGLVQWLLLNKKLNHWKSTRATAEVIYALVHYLEREGALGVREAATVTAGPRTWELTFEPDRVEPEIEPAPGAGATGQPNQIVIPGGEVDPDTMATIVVEKSTPSFLFASATWHFSTDRLPEEARGDLFGVTRRYYRRAHQGDEWVLRPLDEGAPLAVGDQVEVHLSVTARHAAEYVHLRDPRGAGFEPQTLRSGYRWDLGIGRYEEVRDSGANFFFEWLPAGEYTFRYRLRAATAGAFRAGPATLRSMYAPEFTAYSAGHRLRVQP